jgi:hypothetical protein
MPLSVPKYNSAEVKAWLEKDTRSTLAPMQTQAQKRRDETNNALQSLQDASKMLLDNSQKEIEKRNMKIYNRARALNKLAHLFMERLKKLTPPDQVSYDSLNIYASETQKTLTVLDIDIRNWFPRISPFFIMDRRKFLQVYEKTKLTYESLNDFMTKEYVKTKTLEKTFTLIDELQTLEKQLSEVEAAKETLKNERLQIEQEIAELEQQTANLKSKTSLEQLSRAEAEADALNNELKQALRHLQKPFIKMQALQTSGGGAGITPDELKKVEQYLENPFEALLTEQTNCQTVKDILQKLTRLMSEDKLHLKDEKARKAEATIEEIFKTNSLDVFQTRCVEVNARKKQLEASPEIEEAKRGLLAYQQQMEKLKTRHSNLEADERVKENQRGEVLERIRTHRKNIEANVQSFLGKQIQVQ